MNKGMIIVVSGPSGVGKTTVVRAVMERIEGLQFSISHTTRPPRGHEKNGREYYFVTREEFQKMIQNGEFIEWAEVFGHLYGTSKKELEKKMEKGDVLLDIDVQGAISVEKLFPSSIRIILFPPSMKSLKDRMKNRGDTSVEDIEKRFSRAAWELQQYKHFTHIVINDDLENSISKVISIIIGERHRRERMEEKIRGIFWEK